MRRMDDAPAHAVALTTAQLVERARALARDGRRRLLGIVGAPGAGKSTLAEVLALELGDGLVALAGMDAFHLSNEVLHAHGSHDRKGAIDTFDDRGYASFVERLAAARPGDPPVYAPRFDRTLEESINAAVEIGSNVPLVVTEGNYLLADSGAWPRARATMAEVWFLDPPEDLRHARLIARHERFGRSPAEAAARALGSDEVNAHLIRSTAPRADLLVAWRD